MCSTCAYMIFFCLLQLHDSGKRFKDLLKLPLAHESGWPVGLAAVERNLPDEIN